MYADDGSHLAEMTSERAIGVVSAFFGLDKNISILLRNRRMPNTLIENGDCFRNALITIHDLPVYEGADKKRLERR